MKRIISIILAAAVVFMFSGCDNTTPNTNDETEATTIETPVAGENNVYTYDEYSDHIVLTSLKGNVTSVVLPVSINGKPVTSFGTIFRSNLTLSNVTIPSDSNYTAIEENAFSECNNLMNFIISGSNESLTTIKSNAFFGCQGLKTVRIPATVTEIADDAFKYCTDLIVYGTPGSAIEEFASGFSSIYFRDADSETTAAPVENESTSQEDVSAEETGTVPEEISTETVTEEKETTTKKKQAPAKKTTTEKETTKAPETTTNAPETTTRSLLSIFDLQ